MFEDKDPMQDSSSKGIQMMYRFGYMDGHGLGKQNQGEYTPVAFTIAKHAIHGQNRHCLGYGETKSNSENYIKPIRSGIHIDTFNAHKNKYIINETKYIPFEKGIQTDTYKPSPHFISYPKRTVTFKNIQNKISHDMPVLEFTPQDTKYTPQASGIVITLVGT